MANAEEALQRKREINKRAVIKYRLSHVEQIRSRARQYAREHKEEIIAYREKSREKRLAWGREYYAKHQEERNVRFKEWYQNNRERVMARTNEWRRSHPQESREIYARRHAREKGADGAHTVKEWEGLNNLFGHSCLACGKTGMPLTRDHIIPLKSGGSDDISNIQPLCKSCNSSKHTKTIDYRPIYFQDWT